MVTKTATRPLPRSSHSHSHSQNYRSPKGSTTPVSPQPRAAISVGQPLPPSASTVRRSPATQEDRSTSPGYFGLVIDGAGDSRDAPKDHWSPPPSAALSFGGGPPKLAPVAHSTDFEAFRRSSIANNGGSNLGHGNLSYFTLTPGASPRPRPDVQPSISESQPTSTSPISMPNARTPGRVARDAGGESAYASSSEIRQASDSLMDAPAFSDGFPASIMSPVRRHIPPRLDDRHHRPSSSLIRGDAMSMLQQSRGHHNRGEPFSSAREEGPIMLAPAQLKDMIENLPSSEFLLLDLRVAPQFSASRIKDALNLCIPTTLLKRPSFNVQKLMDTFASNSEKERFSQWKNAKYIIVYDAQSSEKRDATTAVNTVKKFSNEGFKGTSYILQGGFAEFEKAYPSLVDKQSTRDMQPSKINLSLGTSMSRGAAVAGGCMMPATKNAANPFFSNIRQNQDLIDGVGQMSIKLPEGFGDDTPSILPHWLGEVVAKEDHGKKASEKFLRLELEEQSRMTKALSHGASYGDQTAKTNDVQIAGIEKGGKNRYNNIWPFEHARVVLQDRPEGACDYINASHIKASRSNKRYIASQGPLPATFEDFWTVIWEQDVRVIVMLTAEHEGGQLKCHSYWQSGEYGPLNVKLLSEKKVSLNSNKLRLPEPKDHGRRRATTTTDSTPILPATEPPVAIIRTFTLSHSSHPFTPIREITQIHYSSWPDFGAPASPSQILSLVDLSNQTQYAASSPREPNRSMGPEDDENSRPMLVHCSAGCGRTGTFCTIDSVIDMIKRQLKERKSGATPLDITPSAHAQDGSGQWLFDDNLDLIESTVEDFRSQRLSMVQSLKQYVLCYEAVVEWVAHLHIGGKTGRGRTGSVGEGGPGNI